jgi:hypothetical protein
MAGEHFHGTGVHLYPSKAQNCQKYLFLDHRWAGSRAKSVEGNRLVSEPALLGLLKNTRIDQSDSTRIVIIKNDPSKCQSDWNEAQLSLTTMVEGVNEVVQLN